MIVYFKVSIARTTLKTTRFSVILIWKFFANLILYQLGRDPLTVCADRREHVSSSSGFAEGYIVNFFVVRDQLSLHVARDHVNAAQHLTRFEAPARLNSIMQLLLKLSLLGLKNDWSIPVIPISIQLIAKFWPMFTNTPWSRLILLFSFRKLNSVSRIDANRRGVRGYNIGPPTQIFKNIVNKNAIKRIWNRLPWMFNLCASMANRY